MSGQLYYNMESICVLQVGTDGISLLNRQQILASTLQCCMCTLEACGWAGLSSCQLHVYDTLTFSVMIAAGPARDDLMLRA